ncbi:MAG TPA: ATP-binding protein [Gaiellaceae bacterium]|nr:ATP-binding protein [Gaiellaceae bacterium]
MRPVGDLDYEVTLLALADAAAANLATRGADPEGPAALASAIADERALPPAAVSLALLTRIAMSPQLIRLPAERAIELELGTLASLARLSAVSLWTVALAGVECRFPHGAGDAATRAAAERLLDVRDGEVGGGDTDVVAAPVLRADTPVAAVVARLGPGERAEAEPFLEVVCRALGLVLEREALLEHGEEAEATLVAAHERRLTRLAFDLHDGPLQEIAVMAADLHRARSHADRSQTHDFDVLLERLTELNDSLRDVAHSLETADVVRGPLADVVRREVDAFGRKSGIGVRLTVRGDLDALTDSQKIALLRIVQEGLSNVREHSSASTASVVLECGPSSTRLEVADDGRGFDVEPRLDEAVRRGRLGLLGASERIRLLGGTLAIHSGETGTRLVVSLPRRER